MAMVRSYVAGFFPPMDERKESLMAQAPSNISSTPGLSHPDVLWIQPLLNKVCVSAHMVSFSNTSSRSRTSCDKEGIGIVQGGWIPSCPGEWTYTSSARCGKTGATDRVTPSRIFCKTVWHDRLPSESSGSQYNLIPKETERSWELTEGQAHLKVEGFLLPWKPNTSIHY